MPKKNDEMPMETEVGMEAPETAPEEMTPPESTPMIHTVDEIPELKGKAVGDIIQLRIDSISDDGVSYEMSVVAGEEAPIAAGGKEKIKAAMLK